MGIRCLGKLSLTIRTTLGESECSRLLSALMDLGDRILSSYEPPPSPLFFKISHRVGKVAKRTLLTTSLMSSNRTLLFWTGSLLPHFFSPSTCRVWRQGWLRHFLLRPSRNAMLSLMLFEISSQVCCTIKASLMRFTTPVVRPRADLAFTATVRSIVLLACSPSIAPDKDLVGDSVKDYTQLVIVLDTVLDVSFQEKTREKLLDVISETIEKLDLSYAIKADDSTDSADASASALLVSKPADVAAFAALAQFAARVFESISDSVLRVWTLPLLRQVLSRSQDFPLVEHCAMRSLNVQISGLYDIAAILLKNLEKLITGSMPCDVSDLSFVRDYVLHLCSRLKRFHDTLQQAAVAAVLSCPPLLLSQAAFLSTLRLALVLGVSYPYFRFILFLFYIKIVICYRSSLARSHTPTAVGAISALERWTTMPNSPALDDVLPLLREYIKNSSHGAVEMATPPHEATSKKRKRTDAASVARLLVVQEVV